MHRVLPWMVVARLSFSLISVSWWRDCNISYNQRCLAAVRINLAVAATICLWAEIVQKIVAVGRKFSLQRPISVCSFSKILQKISNGQNLYWNDLKYLLNPKRHVFTNWDMSLHKRHDFCDQESQLFKKRHNVSKIVDIYSLNMIRLTTCSRNFYEIANS